MNLSLPDDVLDQMALEQAHFDAAPQAFFEAWRRGAQIGRSRVVRRRHTRRSGSVPPPGTCGLTC